MEKIYYYECLCCGSCIKQSQRVAAPALVVLYCPHCKQYCKVMRLICKTSFILKGVNWAKDSYSLQKEKGK